MARTLFFALLALTIGCGGGERDGFATGEGGSGDDDDVVCEVQDFSYLVQDIVDVSEMSHYTCDAPAVSEDGPAFDGFFSPSLVVPGGLLTVRLFTQHSDDLVGRTLILDAPEELGHSRFVLDEEHMVENGARFQVLVRADLAAGPQTLSVALLDDYGDVEATGPAVVVPVEVIEVDPEPRGLRVSLNFWSEDDPEARPNVNLQVFEPSGNRVDADQPQSDTGGVVEFDGNADCDGSGNLESISWPQGSEAGRYSAFAFFADECDYETDFHWTATFSYFDRLLGVWEGEISPPHDDDPESEIIDLSFVDLQ